MHSEDETYVEKDGQEEHKTDADRGPKVTVLVRGRGEEPPDGIVADIEDLLGGLEAEVEVAGLPVGTVSFPEYDHSVTVPMAFDADQVDAAGADAKETGTQVFTNVTETSFSGIADGVSVVPDEDSGPDTYDELLGIGGVREEDVDALRDAGYGTIEDLQEAEHTELSERTGISMAKVARIKSGVS